MAAMARASLSRPLFALVALSLALLVLAGDDLVITRADRKIDLQSHVVRIILSLKLENTGSSPVSRVLLALPPSQQLTLAQASVLLVQGKAKSRSFTPLPTAPLSPEDPPAPAGAAAQGLLLLAAVLPAPVAPGGAVLVEAYLSFLGLLAPFPTQIAQSEAQLLLFRDSSYIASPYAVRTQTTSIKLPSSRVERFEAAEPSRKADSELRLGPYENVDPSAAGAEGAAPLLVHFENNRPMPVAAAVTRELEVSHWGNVYVTEDYDIVHEGATLKGVFSRLELQMRPHSSGVHSLKGLLAVLPRTARSVYFRDEIGNISTSNLRQEPRRAVLELSPRYPLFGGWRTTFRVGYSVPLQELLSVGPGGQRTLNATFGTPFQELPVRSLTVKVVLPEGSFAVAAEAPFSLNSKHHETKWSYLDVVGRPVVVLHKDNVVQENAQQHFQVRYKFAPLSLFVEPLLLVLAFGLFFASCAAYVRLDLTIAKSSPAYQAKLQTDLLMDAVQRLQSAVLLRLRAVDALDLSLQRLGRTGDVAQAKATRRQQEERLKETGRLVRDAMASIEALPKAPKAQALAQQIALKDKEYAEKAVKKHAISVEAYEKSLPEREIEDAVAPLAEKLAQLRLELKALLIALDD